MDRNKRDTGHLFGFSRSLPSRERGSKSDTLEYVRNPQAVAPFAGAWIEIPGMAVMISTTLVAPFAGAWIEMFDAYTIMKEGKWSLPSRERGSKL